MTTKFRTIIQDAIQGGISGTGFDYSVVDGFIFKFGGFSKSGEAEIYENDGFVYCKTRYDKINQINNFDDLVHIAFIWWKDYSDTEPFKTPDQNFLPHFLRLGLVEKVVETTYKIKK
jgi:hypothetical protein